MIKKNKIRPPIEQLRAAGKWAKEQLIKKGILAKDSILDKIAHEKDAPLLPGYSITYLPHRWTLQASQHMMKDFLSIWIDECQKKNPNDAEDVVKFFTFLVHELHRQEKKVDREIKEMSKTINNMSSVPLLKDVFSPLRKKETIRSMHRFFVDSFAVAIILKNNTTTSQFANWFLDWTQQLYLLWIKPEKREEFKQKQ